MEPETKETHLDEQPETKETHLDEEPETKKPRLDEEPEVPAFPFRVDAEQKQRVAEAMEVEAAFTDKVRFMKKLFNTIPKADPIDDKLYTLELTLRGEDESATHVLTLGFDSASSAHALAYWVGHTGYRAVKAILTPLILKAGFNIDPSGTPEDETNDWLDAHGAFKYIWMQKNTPHFFSPEYKKVIEEADSFAEAHFTDVMGALSLPATMRVRLPLSSVNTYCISPTLVATAICEGFF